MGLKMLKVTLQSAIFALAIKVATGCGGELIGSGNITSPNYPNHYPMNSRCTWTFSEIPGHVVYLRMIYFDTEDSYDYIEIFNGTTESSSSPELFRRYSGWYYNDDRNYYDSQKPTLIGPSATVNFMSDSSISASGFIMEYISVNQTPYTDCGGELVGSGNISSPNYPSNYPMNSRCTWTFSGYPGHEISLRMINYYTEGSYDYIEIFNGTAKLSSSPELFRRYSGRYYNYDRNYYDSQKPTLSGPSATVKFVSDSSISASGFIMEYISVNLTPYTDCGGELAGSGNITSPNYPNNYPINCRCTWTLSGHAGHGISLRMVNVQIEHSYDYIKIFNGTTESSSSPELFHRNSGWYYDGDRSYYIRQKPTLIGPSATVTFVSDSSISSFGFIMEYISVNITPYTECGGELVGSGIIKSPNYPNNYPINCRCTWTLSETPDHLVWLRLSYLNMEDSYDYIEVLNGTTTFNNSPKLLRQYSGRRNGRWGYYDGRVPMLIGPSATVKFVSDSSVSAPGFTMEYIRIGPYTDCGGALVGSGNITSPNYPKSYPMNSRCTWTIKAANPGHAVLLRMIQLDTQDSGDYVLVFNGTTSSVSQNFTHRYSGRHYRYHYNNQKPVLMGPSATVMFVSDNADSGSGFIMEYIDVDLTPYTECGGKLVGSGVISSPNYPNSYPLNCRCTWTLSANRGHFSLWLTYLHTEDTYDYIEMLNGTAEFNNSPELIHRYSGRLYSGWSYYNSRVPNLIGSSLTVTFVSDSSISASGFRIEYALIDLTPYTGCGGELFGSGNITSPNYPDSYPLNCRCTWTISANPGHAVSLRIIYLATQDSHDYIDVFNGTTTSDVSEQHYGRYYGRHYNSRKPMIMGPSAAVTFVSDSSISSSGFILEYTSIDLTPYTGCGGDLVGSGNITSPNYPDSYPMNCRCTWTISANHGHAISLRILHLDMPESLDYIHVFNETTTYGLLREYYRRHYNYYYDYYANQKPVLLGPSATVTFVSDSSISASGFVLEYTSIDLTPYTGCGGALVGSGNITSPNYPDSYPMNCRCTWTISANPGHAVSLRILHLDMPESPDYIDVLRGAATFSFSGQLSRHYTGRYYNRRGNYYDNLEPMLMGPRATVKFVSDSSISASGFIIEFTSVALTPYTESSTTFDSASATSANVIDVSAAAVAAESNAMATSTPADTASNIDVTTATSANVAAIVTDVATIIATAVRTTTNAVATTNAAVAATATDVADTTTDVATNTTDIAITTTTDVTTAATDVATVVATTVIAVDSDTTLVAAAAQATTTGH